MRRARSPRGEDLGESRGPRMKKRPAPQAGPRPPLPAASPGGRAPKPRTRPSSLRAASQQDSSPEVGLLGESRRGPEAREQPANWRPRPGRRTAGQSPASPLRRSPGTRSREAVSVSDGRTMSGTGLESDAPEREPGPLGAEDMHTVIAAVCVCATLGDPRPGPPGAISNGRTIAISPRNRPD